MRVLLFLAILAISSVMMAQTQSDMLEEVMSSVVTVTVAKSDYSNKILGFRGDVDDAYQKRLDLEGAHSSGSGFIIEKNDKLYVITNAHVIETALDEPGSVFVYTIDQSKYEMRIVGGDSFYDIAVLEFVDKPGDEISILKIRLTEARIGEPVFAIGNPLGEFPYTVSQGIISAKNRVRGGATGQFGFYQTTATVIWGNSGGPLVDANGELLGINSQIAFADNDGDLLWQPQINFALESILSNRLIDEILNNDGRVIRSFLGIELCQTYTKKRDRLTHKDVWELNDSLPVLTAVLRGTPAYKDLNDKIGYVLYSVNSVEIRDMQEALGEFEKIKPGETITLGLKDDNEQIEVSFITQELTPERNEQLAKHIVESDKRLVLSEKDNGVKIDISYLLDDDSVSEADIEKYALLSVGILTETVTSLWRVNTIADVGAAIRLSGLNGFYHLIIVDIFDEDEELEKFELDLSDQDDLKVTKLWY